MRTKRRVSAIVILGFLSAAGAALAGSYGTTIQLYVLNFDWQTSTGTAAYPTFLAPNGKTVHYEVYTIGGGGTSWPTCIEFGATTLNSGDLIVYFQRLDGTWHKLADNVTNGVDPNAVIYNDGTLTLIVRIADVNASPPGYAQVRTEYIEHTPGASRETECNQRANFRGFPYLKVKSGSISVSNVH
jgi:hypothetical protein